MSAGDRNNSSGDVQVTAATGGYTRGQIYLIADAYFVARQTAAAAADCLMAACQGVVEVTKATGTGKSFVVGDKVYVLSNKAQPATATGAVLLPGVVWKVAATTDATVLINFDANLSPAAT